ncbi:hypothetical protein Mapa_000346 [Marchantia paleacea]|nr:hypothetical protein Mapa_000346 [Marchantia paleacea]
MEPIENQKNFSISNQRPAVKSAPIVWLVPLPFLSHVMCFTHLARNLASHGLRVALFISEEDLQRLLNAQKNMLDSWKLEGLDIQLRVLKLDEAIIADGGVGGNARFVNPIYQADDAFEKTLTSELQSESKPTCVIVDFWMPGPRETAAKFGIPGWTFCSFSAAYLSIYTYLSHLETVGVLKLPDNIQDKRCEEEMISLPGLPVMRLHDLGSVFFKDDPLNAPGRRNGPSLQNSDVILLSGFFELEPRQTRGLERLLKAYAVRNCRKAPHIWHIGPTFLFLSSSKGPEAVRVGADEKHPSIKFLDSQPASSVVFVAFGSDVNHTRKQIHEIAYGLENSQQPFLCVLHPPKKGSDVQADDIFLVIPQDCLARTRGRGLFVQSYVPQMEVLSHPSTGAFISHCGQNSLLETVSMGVPILAWPCLYDQSMNCRFLVDEAQLALEICPGLLQGGYVDRKQIETSIHSLFHTKEGSALKQRAFEMKQKAREALGENGSSTKNMQALLDLIEGLAKANQKKSAFQIS